MFPLRSAPAAAILVLSTLPLPGAAGASEPFPPPIWRGTEITVLHPDSSRTRATFLGPGSTPDHVLLEEPRVRGWGGVNRYELARSDVSAIEARTSPGFEPSRGAIAVLGGMLVGGVIGAMIDPGYDAMIALDGGSPFSGSPDAKSRVPNIATGMAFGAAFGFLFGVLATPTRGPVQRWSYEEPAPGPVPTPSDSTQVPQR